MISGQAGWPREKMLRPEIISDDLAGFNGQRITAARWDASLPPAEAAKCKSRHRVAGAIGRRDMTDGHDDPDLGRLLEAAQTQFDIKMGAPAATLRPG